MAVRSGPVTFGQLSVFRSIEYAGQEMLHEVNLPQAWPVTSDADPAALEAVWFRLRQANESLRTVFDLTAATPVQSVLPASFEPLTVIELEADTDDAASGCAGDMAAELFAIDREPGCCAAIGMYRGRSRYFLSAYHHVVADMAATQSLHQQFNSLLNGAPLAAQPQPLDLSAEQRGDLAQQDATIAHWTRGWPGLAREDRIGVDSTQRVQAAIFSEEARASAAAAADRLGISASSAVLAVTYVALAHATGRDRLTLGLMASNRFHQRWESLVSSMNQLVPLTVQVDPAASTDEFLTGIYGSSLEAYSHGSFDVDLLRQRLTDLGIAAPDPMQFDCYVNFRGPVGVTPPVRSQLRTGVVWQPPRRKTGPSFDLGIATSPEGMTLGARASSRYLDGSKVGPLLAGIESALACVASGAPETLSDINLTPRRALTA
jgi:hypothetical protein